VFFFFFFEFLTRGMRESTTRVKGTEAFYSENCCFFMDGG